MPMVSGKTNILKSLEDELANTPRGSTISIETLEVFGYAGHVQSMMMQSETNTLSRPGTTANKSICNSRNEQAAYPVAIGYPICVNR